MTATGYAMQAVLSLPFHFSPSLSPVHLRTEGSTLLSPASQHQRRQPFFVDHPAAPFTSHSKTYEQIDSINYSGLPLAAIVLARVIYIQPST